MSSPFRESVTVTCVGCGEGVPREKTDITERGNLCERCLNAEQLDGSCHTLVRPEPKLSDQPLRSDKPVDRLVDKAIDVLGEFFHSVDEE